MSTKDSYKPVPAQFYTRVTVSMTCFCGDGGDGAHYYTSITWLLKENQSFNTKY